MKYHNTKTENEIMVVFKYKDGSCSDPIKVENRYDKKIDSVEVYKGQEGEETIIGFIPYDIHPTQAY
jgi:hypothetical protein